MISLALSLSLLVCCRWRVDLSNPQIQFYILHLIEFLFDREPLIKGPKYAPHALALGLS